MAPPSYSDLGKSTRDIFSKGYHFGLFKLNCKASTVGGVDISTGGTHSLDEGKVFGDLETKYKFPAYGVTLTEKWNTDNLLVTEISCQDKLVEGGKVAVEGVFSPDSGKKSGTLKSSYKSPNATIDVDVSGGDAKSLLVNGAVVLGYQGWLGGYQLTFDTVEGVLKKNNFAAGYSAGDFQINTNIDNGETFAGSLYQRVNNRLEAGVQLSWTAGGESTTRFGLGARYLLDPCTAVRAKVNNQSQVGLGFEQKLRQGITLTLSTFIDGKNFKAGGHKIGLALELEQ
ncbi:voltage-dependent anion-selective channel [Folsomia candida]|uniref:Voltage-dependent anion-selective channel n=1 Tax=Folsomia candida TaxID=158441 RepID=A0A226ESP9_FOLCA|nr:voltage-dependent anion-selective channel [Folsomia candida]OXA60197.1 Voltage-dependent anion-selective channel [Folsomia candida]